MELNQPEQKKRGRPRKSVESGLNAAAAIEQTGDSEHAELQAVKSSGRKRKEKETEHSLEMSGPEAASLQWRIFYGSVRKAIEEMRGPN